MGFAHFGIAFLLTKLFCLILALGVVFFLVWAFRTFDKKELKKWAMGLLIVGVVGVLLCSLLGATQFGKKAGFKKFDGKKWGCEDKVEEPVAE